MAVVRTLARTLIGVLLTSVIIACQASEPSDEVVCPADRAAADATPLLVDFGEPVREQLAACELDRRAWPREATVEDDVGPELAAEYREAVQHALTGPRRALVVRVLESDRAGQIAERLREAGVEVTRVDLGRRPTRAELDAVLRDFAWTGEPGLAIVSLDGLANEAGPCLRLADGCVPLTWLRDRIHTLDEGLRVVTLGGQASVAALRVLADAKTIAVVTSEDGLERFWMARPPGLGEIETFADRATRTAATGAPIRLHEPIAGIALGRVDQPLPERGRVTLAYARHDLELTRTMLDDDEPAYFALIPEECGSCQLFRDSYFELASVDDHRRFWRIAQRESLGIIDAALRGREYRRRNPGFGFRSGEAPELEPFEPRIAIAAADGRYLPVDEIGVPQASLWRLYGVLGVDAELAYLRAGLRPGDDAIELVPILAALARHPDGVAGAGAIASLFEHADGRVRLRALDAHVNLAGIDATSRCALLAALGDPDRRVRLWARSWIHDPRLDPELLAAAVAVLLEQAITVRVPGGTQARQRDLIATLGQLARSEGAATRLLVTLLETPRYAGLQGEVSRAIASVGPKAASATSVLVALVEGAREPNPNVLQALAAIGHDAACAAPRLRAIADDPSRPPEARKQIRDTVDAIVATGP